MGRKMKLDFTGVESFQRVEEGKHVVKVATADVKQSQGGNDMIVVAFEVTRGESKGGRVFENFPLVDNALWKLKGLLQAIGMKADGKVQLDLDKLVGKVLIIEVKHEEYEGKTRAKVDQMYKFTTDSVDEDDEEEDEVEEEAEVEEKPAKKSAKKSKPEPEEEEDSDEDDWDEDEEEEEEKPAPKKKAPAKKAEKKATKKSKDEEEDEDEDWDEDEDDDWDEE